MALQIVSPNRFEGPVTIGDATLVFKRGVADGSALPSETVEVLRTQGFMFIEGRLA
ncbi:hypothetical protein [Rhodococcus sp. RS1C4]|nr:hypothetical protein [Rhodococcus sp. RS1C4]